jgi:hypothetical protein
MTKISILSVALISTVSFAKDYTPEECPVVGNTNSKIYHTQDQIKYGQMLVKNKGQDNRKCFQTEKEAQKAKFRPSKV